jgi:hypothetical protein
MYQNHPNAMQMCGTCKFYVPPNGRAGCGMIGGGVMDEGMMRGRAEWCVKRRNASAYSAAQRP